MWRELFKEAWGVFADGYGYPLLFPLIPSGITWIYQSRLPRNPEAVMHVLSRYGYPGLIGLFLMVIYCIGKAHCLLLGEARKEIERIKKDSVGSAIEVPKVKMEIIHKPQFNRELGLFFWHGKITNNGSTIRAARIFISEIKGKDRTEEIEDMFLQWKSGDRSHRDIAAGQHLIFDLITTKNLIHGSIVSFIGYEGTQEMGEKVGEGEFTFVLKLWSENFKEATFAKKIKIAGKEASSCIEVLE